MNEYEISGSFEIQVGKQYRNRCSGDLLDTRNKYRSLSERRHGGYDGC